MRTYCQATQDAADELQMYALHTSDLYPSLLKAQRRTRNHLAVYPNVKPEDIRGYYGAFYAKARTGYRNEIGKLFETNVINCAKLMQAREDLEELRSTPTAFDWITDEAIAKTY